MGDEFEIKDGKLVIRSIAFLNDDFTRWFSENFIALLKDFLEYNNIGIQDLIDRWSEFKNKFSDCFLVMKMFYLI